MSLLVRQGFNWRDTFGVLIVVRESTNPNVPLISRLLRIEDFRATANRELIYGVFWLEEFIFNLPYSTTRGNLSIGIEIVKNSDVNDDPNSAYYGTITNYPEDLVPLVYEMPTTDNIDFDIDFNRTSHILTINPKTKNGDTLQHAIYDYFNIEDNQIINISLSYEIIYGYTDHYQTLIISSSEDDLYRKITLGIDFYPLLTYYDNNNNLVWNTTQNVDIFVTMNINVNNKVLRRQNYTNPMNVLQQLNQFVLNTVSPPNTIYPVTYAPLTEVTYDMVKVQERRKIVPLYQYIFAELIDTQIIYEKKNIKFDNVTFPCYLVFKATEKDKEQMIINEQSSDGTYYFNLTKINPLTEPTTYSLIKIDTEMIVGKGEVILNN
jgi:hypothetical protein